MGLFDKLKKKESSLPDTPTKRYEFTETGKKVLVDDNYRPKKSLFNSERKQQFISGAKKAGGVVKRGLDNAVENDTGSLKRGIKRLGEMSREQSVNDYGFGYGDMVSERRGGKKQRRESYDDIQGGMIGRGDGPSASDITDSILGTGGKRRKKGRDMFDFSDL